LVHQRPIHQLEPWNVSEDEFPAKGSMYDKLKFFLRYAILAPSIRNTQPWAFRILSNNTIELYADTSRALTVVDPDRRQLIISCGAALGYLQITINHFGYKYQTGLLSASNEKKEDKRLLAKISINGGTESVSNNNNNTTNKQRENNTNTNLLQKEDGDRLFGAIPKRRTNRFRFEDRNIPDILLAGFYYILDKYPQYQEQQEQQKQDEQREGDQIWLHIVEETDMKNTLAELVAHGDNILLSDKNFVHELIVSTRLNKNYGFRRGALGISNFISKISPYFQISKKQDEKDCQLAATSSALAILGSYSDGVLDWINTGMALTNILLLASSESVSCSFLNQPIQVSKLRPKLLDAIGREKGFPQILLRMGYNSHKIAPSPRRNVEEVLH
jgi:nitroreductase